MRASRVRILLLTPYTGGNLGDQAIQCTFIDNFKLRCPTAEIIGLTLDPRATADIHRIPCFPLSARIAAATSVNGLYWPDKPPAESNGGAAVIQAPDVAKVSVAKATPPLPAHSTLPSKIRSRIVAILRRVPFLLDILRALRALPGEAVFTMRAMRLLRRGDLLIVAGGGQIDDAWGGTWAHPFALWRWTALARLRGARIAVASVGWGQLSNNLSRRFIRTSLRRADYRSYRDRGSALMVESLGLPDRSRFVPDIALGLPVTTGPIHLQEHLITTVGVSPMAFGRQEIWPTTLTDIYENYLHRMRTFVCGSTAQGMKVILFTTARMDHTAVQDLLDLLQDLPEQQRNLLTIARTTTLAPLFKVLADCQIVVASRLHGVILAHRLCLPTLAISFDRKVDAHMADVGHSEFCLDIGHLNEGDVEDHFARIASRTHVLQAELCRFIDAAEPALTTQFDTLASLVNPTHAARSTTSK